MGLQERIAALERRTSQLAKPKSFADALSQLGGDSGLNWYTMLAAVAAGEVAPEARAAIDPLMLEIIGSIERQGNAINWKFATAFERGLADFLFMDMTGSPFKLEKLRGVVPDEILAAVYNKQRNYAYDARTALRVRQLAGVVDGNGEAMQGYVLRDNGCTNDIPDGAH